MAISHPRTWYVDSANGSNANSGAGWNILCYVSDGRTYGSTRLTSESGPFTAEMVGLTVNVAGTLKEIVNYISAYEVTMDSTISSGTNKRVIVGGALKTPLSVGAGDTIKFAQTPEISIGSTTWIDGSKIVTLDTERTTLITDCETAWTPRDNISCDVDSADFKSGNKSAKFVVATNFTSGQIAYFTIDTLDLSSYTKISFWIKSSTNITTTHLLKIALYTSTDGSGEAVDTFSLPFNTGGANIWIPVIIAKDGGGNLSNNVNSIGITFDADPGTPTIRIDNINATNDLGVASLIKPATPDDDIVEECYYPIQSINGTTILLDNSPNTIGNAGRGWSGKTTPLTADTTIIEPYRYASPAGSSSSDIGFTPVAGSEASGVTHYSGGWDTNTGLRTGVTAFDGGNGFGYFSSGGGALLKASYFVITRYRYGFSMWPIQEGVQQTGCNSYSNSSYVFYLVNTPFSHLKNCSACNNNGSGLGGSSTRYILIDGFKCNNNNKNGIFMDGYSTICEIRNAQIRNNANYGIQGYSSYYSPELYIYNSEFKLNTKASLDVKTSSRTEYKLFNCLSDDSTFIEQFTTNGLYPTRVISINHNQLPDNHYIWLPGGTISAQQVVRHTNNGYAWVFNPTSTIRSIDFPLTLKVATVAVGDYATYGTVTATLWVRRDNTALTIRFYCPRGRCGLLAEVTSSISADANEWEQLNLTIKPPLLGVLDFYVDVYGGTTYSGYIDDFDISQA